MFSFDSVQALEQRYVMAEAGERIFLVDTKNGEVWRYYFNTVGDQGWVQTKFSLGSDSDYEYYKTYPVGEVVKVEK